MGVILDKMARGERDTEWQAERMAGEMQGIGKTETEVTVGATDRRPDDGLYVPNEEETADMESSRLATNPDYIALHSSLALLYAQRDAANEHILQLYSLKKKSLRYPEIFLRDLVSGALSLPQPQHIVKCPQIEWQRYGTDPRLELMISQGVVDNVVTKYPTVFSNGVVVDRSGTPKNAIRDNMQGVTRPVTRSDANTEEV